MRKKKTQKQKLKEKADILFSKFIRSHGKCMAMDWPGKVTPCSNQLQCAHRKTRTYLVTRWDERNADCLCAACHHFFHRNPNLHRDFVEWIDPGAWEYLDNLLWQSDVVVTAQDAIEMYKDRIEE